MSSLLGAQAPSTYPTLGYKGMLMNRKIRVFSFGTLF